MSQLHAPLRADGPYVWDGAGYELVPALSGELVTSSLPPDHEFSRPCPWCRRPLRKKHAHDLFKCPSCGWRGRK